MDGTEGQKDTPLAKLGQSSQVITQGTSTQAPETYTREQLQKFRSDALAEQGRKHKAELELITKERDTFKNQLETNTAELEGNKAEMEGNKAEMEKLQVKLDALAEDDPAKFDIVKELKVAREERRQLQAEKRTLETEKKTHGERIKKAEDFEREVLIHEIVEDYKDADASRLMGICTLLNTKSEEQIRKVADTLWAKGTIEPETPSLVPYSGKNEGGRKILGDLPPRERLKEADKILGK